MVGIAAVGMTAVGVAGVGVDTRKTSFFSKSDRKIGHWRVDNEGQVTYKKVTCCHYDRDLTVYYRFMFLTFPCICSCVLMPCVKKMMELNEY